MRPKFTQLLVLLFLLFGLNSPSAFAITGIPQRVQEVQSTQQFSSSSFEVTGVNKSALKLNLREQKRLNRQKIRKQRRARRARASVGNITLAGIISLVGGIVLIAVTTGISGIVFGILGAVLILVGLSFLILGIFVDL